MAPQDYNSVHQVARTAARPGKDEAPTMRVLLVEDDPLLGEALQVGLHHNGFAVDWVKDGMAGLAAMTSDHFDAVVLDLGLPRLDGRRLLELRRSKGDRTPVLVLTARDTIGDRVTGLDAGADDYVVKPVAISELAARLRALVRRASGLARAEVIVGPLNIDPSSRTVTWHGQPVDFAPREFDILLSLALKAGRVLTREQLVSALYEWDESIESNAIEVHVHHLRRKLAPELIRTVRGVGYMMMGDCGTPLHA
jgi:DNA-binding response OmpR family regulator